MPNRTLIRNAQVVLPGETARMDVLVEGAKIAAIDPAPAGAARAWPADEEIDAAGLHLIPGVVDDQVHFREPGLTHKEDLWTAGRACVKGGVTSFLEMPNTRPATVSREALAAKLALAAGRSMANYGFYVGATPNNLMELQLADRTPGIKIFIGSSTGDLLVDKQEDLERIFAETALPLCAHCEDEATIRSNAAAIARERETLGGGLELADHSRIRDHAAALAATRRACDLATRHRHRFHVLHVSTGAELEPIRAARGLVTAETCPHYLLFNISDYARLGTLVQMNPSLKTAEDGAALWAGLADGTLQVIATDHAPHQLEEKRQPYPQSPSGIPAIENSLALMLNEVAGGRVTLRQVVQWMCENPARVWDLVGKGRIEPGADADLVLVDLNKTATVRDAAQATKCGWSPWNGVALTGWPVRTWVMGRTAWMAAPAGQPGPDGAAGPCGPGLWPDAALGQEIQYDHARGGFWAAGR